NPADGGNVGRNRLSADSSPIPRDRVIFNYDFVSNTTLGPTTPSLNRFVFGFEKTFLDGLGSIELRIPFASTVNSASNNNGTFSTGHAELGNLFLLTKVLLSSSDTFAFSGGLAFSLPTADDTRLQLGGGDVLRIRNEAVIRTPYVGALWTPSDRVFAQTWYAVGLHLPAHTASPSLGGKGLQNKGRVSDPTTLQFDIQLGYWVIHPTEGGFLRGLAPFVEFHLNHQLQNQNQLTDGPFALSPSVGQLTEFDLSAGI